MSKKLQIADKEFNYPEVGEDEWGEEATDWAVAVTDAIANVIGPFDILETSAPLSEDKTDDDINQLIFDINNVRQVTIEGVISREHTGGILIESFFTEGIYDGANLILSTRFVGTDTGVTLDANSGASAGQITYSSKSDADMGIVTTVFSIKFRGSAIT